MAASYSNENRNNAPPWWLLGGLFAHIKNTNEVGPQERSALTHNVAIVGTLVPFNLVHFFYYPLKSQTNVIIDNILCWAFAEECPETDPYLNSVHIGCPNFHFPRRENNGGLDGLRAYLSLRGEAI